MKILAVSTWFPCPPDNGVKMRAYHLLRPLGDAHTLDLITMSQSSRDSAFLGKLDEFCRRVATFPEPVFDPSRPSTWLGFFSMTPRYFTDHHLPGMQALAHSWVKEEGYDAVIAVTLGAAPYVAALDVPFKVLDQHNVECRVIRRQCQNEPTLFRRLRYLPTWLKSERYERGLASAFDVIAVVSEHEAEMMASVLRGGSGKDIRVVPNGVDPALLRYESQTKDHGLIVFTGAPTYKPNYDAAESLCNAILPAVRAEIADVRLKITGSTEGTDVSALASTDGVEFTGYVNDIRPLLSSAAALVVPLRFGGGTRLKILEAMAIGTPVVSTPMGAEGIKAEDGVHILRGDSPEQLARQTCRLLSDPGLASRIARNARELVRDRYMWSAIADEFAHIFTEKRGEQHVGK